MSMNYTVSVIYGLDFETDLLDKVLEPEIMDTVLNHELENLNVVTTDYNYIFIGDLFYTRNDIDGPLNEFATIEEMSDSDKSRLHHQINKQLQIAAWGDIKLHVVITYG